MCLSIIVTSLWLYFLGCSFKALHVLLKVGGSHVIEFDVELCTFNGDWIFIFVCCRKLIAFYLFRYWINMFLFFLIADCSWFSSVRDQTALDEEEPSRSSIFTLCFHRDMASEKKMVLNDSVPVSLLTVRMIMQGKVSCLGFFFLHFLKENFVLHHKHTHSETW